MMRFLTRCVCLALCALVLACGDRRDPAEAAAGNGRTCPVCGTKFAKSQTVVVNDPCGEAYLCSRGCALRYSVTKLPPPDGSASRHMDEPESRAASDR